MNIVKVIPIQRTSTVSIHKNMLKSLVQPGSFMGNVIALLTGNLLGQTLLFISTPLITRLYTPGDFGLMAIVASITSVLSVLACMRYQHAIVLPKTAEQARDIIQLSWLISIFVFVILLLVIGSFRDWIEVLLNAKHLATLLWFVPLGVLFTGWRDILSFWNTRGKRFSLLALSHVVASCCSIGVKLIPVLLLHPRAIWLVMGNTIAFVAAFCILLSKMDSKFHRLILKIDYKKLIKTARDYKKFPRYSVPTGLMNSLSQNLPVLMLGYFFSAKEVGYYGLANAVLRKPIQLISTSIGKVFLQRSAHDQAHSKPIRPMLIKTTLGLAAVGAIPFMILFVWGEIIFSWVFGLEWKAAGYYCELLAPWLFLGFINPPSVQVVVVNQDLRFSFWLMLSSIVLRFLSISVGYKVFNNVEACIILFVLSGIVINLIYIQRAFSLTR